MTDGASDDKVPARGIPLDEFLGMLDEASPGYAAGFAERDAQREPMRRLGRNVAKARVAAGLTQRELAKKAGLRQPQLCQLEVGMSNPTWKTILRISAALHPHKLHLDEVLG